MRRSHWGIFIAVFSVFFLALAAVVTWLDRVPEVKWALQEASRPTEVREAAKNYLAAAQRATGWSGITVFWPSEKTAPWVCGVGAPGKPTSAGPYCEGDAALPADRFGLDTPLRLGAATQLWTVLLALQEVQSQRWSLSMPLCELLPEACGPDSSKINLGQLLTHTSILPAHPGRFFDRIAQVWRGATRPEERPTTAEWVRWAKITAPQASPGTGYLHSPLGMILVGAALERSLGSLSFEEGVKERVWNPLQLVCSEWAASTSKTIAGFRYDRGTIQSFPAQSTVGQWSAADGGIACARDIEKTARAWAKAVAPLPAGVRDTVPGGMRQGGVRIQQRWGVPEILYVNGGLPGAYLEVAVMPSTGGVILSASQVYDRTLDPRVPAELAKLFLGREYSVPVAP